MYSQALRFNARLKRAIFAVILSVLCIFLYAAKGFVVESFAATQDETIEGTMSIVFDANQDALKANSTNKDGSNKDSLASTGDVVTTALIAILALSTVLTAFVYVSRRRLAVNTGKSFTLSNNCVKSAALVMLTITLLSGTIFTAFRAFAEGEDADALVDSTAALSSKVVVDEDGNIKSTEFNLKNNLKTAVTVKSISAPSEVSAWTANVDADTVVAAGDTLAKDWTPDADTIPAELLSKLKDGEEVKLTFSTEVSYTVFNVRWYINGGRDEKIPVSVIPENSNFVLPAETPTKEHYTFGGWNTYASGEGVVVDEEFCRTHVVTRDAIIYAKWIPETYIVDFQFPDGGDFAGGVEPERSYTYGVGVDSFEEPYKQGYDFDGWYDAATSGNKVISITTTDFGDKTLYARWTPSTHTSYHVQHCFQDIEGDGYTARESEDETLYGSTDSDTNAQYKTFPGFIGSTIDVKKIVADGSTTVKVYYNRYTYSVYFNMNGITGSPVPATQTVRYQGKVTKPATDPTATGYTFTDWYATASGAGVAFNFDSTQITSATTLYARWTPITYTVKFDKNDAAATGTMTDQTFTYDAAQNLKANTFTKTDSTFAGWAETSAGEVKYTDAQEVKNLANTQGKVVTLYAKWEELATTFLAPATGSVIANPRNISDTKYSITQVKTAATDIASNGASSSYYSQYKEWMDNDTYHLYTLLKRTDWEYLDSDDADSWCEFRIVHVGQLDSDGTGLTFQAVHMLPTAYQMNSTDTNRGGWASSALRTKMQAGGEVYKMFDLDLTYAAYNVTNGSKGKLWLPSYSELTGTSQSFVASDGSQFAYWNGQGSRPTGANACLSIKGTRSGGSVALIAGSGYWWGRSPSTLNYWDVMYVSTYGYLTRFYGASSYLGVVPCFSL